MKCIVYVRVDGGITRGDISQSLLATMMGGGAGWNDDRIAYEIDKWVNPPSPGVGLTLAIATAYVNGIASGGLTEAQAIEAIRAKDVRANVASCAIIDDDDLPGFMKRNATEEERYFRNAAGWDGSTCICDMPKARGVHMDVIRVSRNAELAAKDITFMRAVEAGDTSTQSTIATEKQVLRDIPQTFDLTTDTPEQLKAKWPTELPARE